MALGLGFNKAKILQSAEKYVLQGKLPAAIAEYQKILKKDPKDLMTLNTVGDLYLRSGKTDEAIQCFYELAEKSIEAGFVPRAIAVYKRITKIDPEALTALNKLGELYSMQGLMRDARAHYLQAVDLHLKRREPVKAREIFEKILMLDMENPRLQRRMAELYVETDKKDEAIATYLSATERYLERQEPAEAATTLDALLKLAPDNVEAQVLRGRVLLQQGEVAKAIETLQLLVASGAGKTAQESLFQALLQQGDLEHAAKLAQQLFETHEDFSGLERVAAERIAKGDVEGALHIYQTAAEKLRLQGATQVLITGLKRVLQAEATNIAALELLWDVYRATGEVGEGRETAELLAHAYVSAGHLEQARDVYAELVAMEPDVVDHQRLLKQVEARLGAGGGELESPGEPLPLMAMEVAAAPAEESTRVETLPPREQAVVKNCLTESELYLTYKQLPRAIETLEKGLHEVPGDASLYEHLLPLYEQTQQYAKAAGCAEALTEIYVRHGDGERAARYGELVVSYQQKAAQQPAEGAAAVSAEPQPADLAGMEPSEAAADQPQVREIDLSMEWASLSDSAAAAPAATADSTAEEIEFYLQAGLLNEAAAAIGRLREASPEHPSLAGFDERLVALLPGTIQVAEQADEELAAEPVPNFEETAPASVAEVPLSVAEAPPPEAGEKEIAEAVSAGTADILEPPSAEQFVEPSEIPSEPQAEIPLPLEPQLEPELQLDDLVPAGASASAAGFELSLEELSSPEPSAAADQFASLAGELRAELPAGVTGQASALAPTPVAATPSAPAAGGFLDDVFAEFKEDLGEAATGGEDDLETHYNMGVAFKEMALYDEAIGEFQKVYQLAESAKDYSHIVQCCSLLATCFLEKGMPQLAAQWYQTAINSPGVDADSSLALLYELGAAQELAGDRPAALKSFMEVYGRNIDYRNVAERIRDLQQTS